MNLLVTSPYRTSSMHYVQLYTIYNKMGTLCIYSITTREHVTNPTLIRYCHAQLTTADRCVLINSDISLLEMSDLKLMVDSSAKRRCSDKQRT
jgi:hypothetical protein